MNTLIASWTEANPDWEFHLMMRDQGGFLGGWLKHASKLGSFVPAWHLRSATFLVPFNYAPSPSGSVH